jgi:hypothetical protein
MIGHGPPDQDQLRRHAIAAHGEGVAVAVVGAIDQHAAQRLGYNPAILGQRFSNFSIQGSLFEGKLP